ncbi:enoyl-CoA hydratase/isomerase family protein [Thermodesulfobacteriota bacterium]
MGDAVYLEKHKDSEHISTLVISHPEKRNALTPHILSKLSEMLGDRHFRETTRVLIVRGEGKTAFSAGYDISRIKTPEKKKGKETSVGALVKALSDIKNFPSPVISMINGFCVGAGCHLAAVTDIRIASEDLRIGMTPTKLGIIYHPDGISDFFNLIGPANTKELFLTGRLYPAKDALKMGLINRVAPKGRLKQTVCALAGRIAENAPLSLKGIKKIVNRRMEAVALKSEAYAEINKLIDIAAGGYDINEGRRAFAEKRKPVFLGR